MDKSNKEKQLVSKLMKHSNNKIPFEDFEDRMMDKIYEEKQKDKAVLGSIRFAWLFFFIGLFLGLLITRITSNLDGLIDGIPMEQIAFFSQIGIALLLLFQLDKLIDFRFKKKL